MYNLLKQFGSTHFTAAATINCNSGLFPVNTDNDDKNGNRQQHRIKLQQHNRLNYTNNNNNNNEKPAEKTDNDK